MFLMAEIAAGFEAVLYFWTSAAAAPEALELEELVELEVDEVAALGVEPAEVVLELPQAASVATTMLATAAPAIRVMAVFTVFLRGKGRKRPFSL